MKTPRILATILGAMALSGGILPAQTMFSTNLYAYGGPGWEQETWREAVRIEATDTDPTAGVWDTDAWENLVATTGSATLTADDGATTATFTRITSRNASPYWWTGVDPGTGTKVARDDSDAVDVGNASLLDGHGSGTSWADENDFPSRSYHFEVSAIPFAVYDVIIYLGVNQGQYFNGKGKIRVNDEIPADPTDKDTGGWGFTMPAGEPDGTLDEITADGDTGNYIVYTLQTGSTFEAQIYGYGAGTDGFTHLGAAGFQIRENTTVAGPVDADVSTVEASPTAVPANGVATSTITVTLKDSTGFFVAGKEVTLAKTSGPGTPDIDPATPVTTAANGTATFTVTSTTAGTVEFTATDITDADLVITQTASVEFQGAGPVDADVSTVVASPTAVLADGTSTSTITVTLKDAIGLLVEGKEVTLADSPGAADIDPDTAVTTDINGEASFTVTSSTAGVEVFTATDATDTLAITQTATVSFVDPNAPLAINVNMYASNGGNQDPEDPATLEGPGGGLGETWNQFNTTSGSSLLATSGVPTSVGFTNNVGSGWVWGDPVLTMLHSSRVIFGKGDDTTHTISGLTPGNLYDVWIASAAENSYAERFHGTWTTRNTTATAGGQDIDNLTTDNTTTWEYGVNYVLFEQVEADTNGEIILDGDATDAGEFDSFDYRLGLSGWQVRETVAPPAIKLAIAANAANPGNYDFKWDSQDGKLYDLVSDTSLATAPDTWPVWLDNADIAGTAPENTLLNVPGGAAPTRFFAVVEKDPPPVLEEDFESDDGGFTAPLPTAGTQWEYGDPDSRESGGTPNPGGEVTTGNNGSTNCWGTGIGNPGWYANPTTDSCLRSPDIDLTGATSAELTFAEALDLDAGDTAVLKLINAAGDVDLGTVYTATDGDITTADWEAANGGSAIDLSAGAGLTVYLQWCLNGTGGASADYMGWYIDDVVVNAN